MASGRSCAQAVAEDEANFDQSPVEIERRSLGKDFDFVERPSEDFFCPVSLELLLEPQLTSCCGHHLSLEAATRLQREGKPCPMCNDEGWSAMLDKYHRRKAHEMRVRCWHKENGCEWVGEVNELKRHTDSCVKRPWECQYCALKCTYGEGEGKHWPTCPKVPEPCPNSCEVGSVERCNMEQHRSVCSLEPVACEMKEFGCSVVGPRKELATHMRESELQHLTVMTMLNLCLSRQLQQDSTERDRKITQLQQEMTEQQTEMKMKMKEMHDVMKTKMNGMQKALVDSTERDRKITQLQQQMTEQQTEMKMKMKEMHDVMKTKMNGMQKAMVEEQEQIFRKICEQQNVEAEFQDVVKAKMQLQKQLVTEEVVDKQKQMLRSLEDVKATDRKISKGQTELTFKITQLQCEMMAMMDGQKQVFQKVCADIFQQQMAEVKRTLSTMSDEEEATGSSCSGTEMLTFQYSTNKDSQEITYSSPFYTHYEGYKLKIKITFYSSDIGAELYLMKGEFDRQLNWPVSVYVRLELLNQAEDHHHVVKTATCSWTKTEKERSEPIELNMIKYSTLERKGGKVQYMMNDCLKFKVIVNVV